eukprot:scaffold158956_cov30-Tisochrysis_lutea.AAC.4
MLPFQAAVGAVAARIHRPSALGRRRAVAKSNEESTDACSSAGSLLAGRSGSATTAAPPSSAVKSESSQSSESAMAAERAHGNERTIARVAEEVTFRVAQGRRGVPSAKSRRAGRAQGLRPIGPGSLARTFIRTHLTPATSPSARVAETLVPAERTDSVELASAEVTHVLAVLCDLRWTGMAILESATARGAQRLRAIWTRPLPNLRTVRRWVSATVTWRRYDLCLVTYECAGSVRARTFPEQSPYLHLHQLHRHVPASQKRLCPPRAPIESNTREHASHTYFPSAFFPGGPVWPFLKRLLQAEQSVLGPSGPGPCKRQSEGDA